jgi:hypothetical protein
MIAGPGVQARPTGVLDSLAPVGFSIPTVWVISFLQEFLIVRSAVRRRPATLARRSRNHRVMQRLDIDRLEPRFALAVPGVLQIGGQSVATYFDAPTGAGSLGNDVLVSITGTSGTATFNGGTGVADGTDITSIVITNASSDFRITFQGTFTTAGPNASDGLVELGSISTTNVIGGVYTVRGPETTVVGTPLNYTTGSPGSGLLVIEGDYEAAIGGDGAAVAIVPLGGPQEFRLVAYSYYDFWADKTYVQLADDVGGSTTSGTVAPMESRRTSYNLGSYSGPNLAANGGIFVDTVGTGSAGGITLSRGLTKTATIDIRGVTTDNGIGLQPGASIVLGTAAKDSVAGTVFVNNASAGSAITFNGAVTPDFALLTRANVDTVVSKIYAAITANAAFNGRVDSSAELAGPLRFNNGFGTSAIVQCARAILDMGVTGDFAGTAVAGSNAFSFRMIVRVAGNLTKTATLNSGAFDLELYVDGGVAKGAVITTGEDATLTIGRTLAGKVLVGQALEMTAGGLNGATIATESSTSITVNGSVTNRSFIESDGNLTLNVTGSVSKVSRILATADITATIGGSFTDGRIDASINPNSEEFVNLSLVVGGNVNNVRMTANNDLNLTVGDVDAGRLSSMSNSRVTSTTGYVIADIAGNLLKSTLLSMDDGHRVTVGGNLLDSDLLYDDRETTVDVGGNFRGRIQGSNGGVTLTTGGSVLKGAVISANQYQAATMVIDVAGNFAGAITSAPHLVFLVDGNVEQAASITARRIGRGYPMEPGLNFAVGGNFAGRLEAVDFTPSNDPDVGLLTLVGGTVTSSGLFRIGQFVDVGPNEAYRFGGNFLGRFVVSGDLDADVTFAGSVNEIVVGGAVQADVVIVGALTHFSSGGSSFLQTGPTAGNFVIGLPPTAVGTITAGSFKKGVNTVVPQLPGA